MAKELYLYLFRMQDASSMENDFLSQITGIIEENLSDEKFGVSELAREAGMSRSNLLRKIQQAARLSASQFIRQVRLRKAMEMLRQSSFNVSEVAYRVGFSSTSYFIKCFREFYGYPPGEVGKRGTEKGGQAEIEKQGRRRSGLLIAAAALLILLAGAVLVVVRPFSSGGDEPEKSIAVLPFRNDSNDTTNVYIINGLMESLLDHLQQIEDLRVVSRTSVEQYRDRPRPVPEIARELNAAYLVEGSGQKIGDQIMLSIQLVEGSSDKHLWSGQFTREAKDIFALQKEVAMRIADEIEAIITPEEEERINKIPTDDLVAYDYFLKGMDHFYEESREGLEEAIPYFEKAIEHDPGFARAYADIAISYAFLDMYQADQQYTDRIDYYADQALLHDSKLAQSLIAKAMSFMVVEAYELAVPYLEKALEYNPNSALVINILSDFYTSYIPDTEKYLEYALKGIRLDIAAQDSADASFIYLHVSNAFMQSGFVDEAEKYIEKSLEYNPGNLYARHLKAFIPYGRTRDLRQIRESLIGVLNQDLSNADVIRDLGMICYYMRDYEDAHTYYRKFIEINELQSPELHHSEYAKIALVWSKVGLTAESEKYLKAYADYAEKDQSIYKNLSLAAYNSSRGDAPGAIEQMKLFSLQEKFPYWYILFLDIDPLFDPVIEVQEFRQILGDIETRFWDYHNRVRLSLEEKGVL